MLLASNHTTVQMPILSTHACMTRAPTHKFHVTPKDIKTHNSESRGQEEAGCTRRMSELLLGQVPIHTKLY